MLLALSVLMRSAYAIFVGGGSTFGSLNNHYETAHSWTRLSLLSGKEPGISA